MTFLTTRWSNKLKSSDIICVHELTAVTFLSKNLYLSCCIKHCFNFRIPVHIVLLETHFYLKCYLKNNPYIFSRIIVICLSGQNWSPCAGEGVLSEHLLLSLKLRGIHCRVNDFSAADTTRSIVCLWHSEGRMCVPSQRTFTDLITPY